ncbi:MAG: hypothetical protein AB7G11_11200 [Phycisphaerales bacterium]
MAHLGTIDTRAITHETDDRTASEVVGLFRLGGPTHSPNEYLRGDWRRITRVPACSSLDAWRERASGRIHGVH